MYPGCVHAHTSSYILWFCAHSWLFPVPSLHPLHLQHHQLRPHCCFQSLLQPLPVQHNCIGYISHISYYYSIKIKSNSNGSTPRSQVPGAHLRTCITKINNCKAPEFRETTRQNQVYKKAGIVTAETSLSR